MEIERSAKELPTKLSRWQRLLVLALVSFAGLHAFIFWKVYKLNVRGYGDFASFYTAGRIVQQGESTQLYNRALQWRIQQDFAQSVQIRYGPLPYIRPPFEALLFLPFAYMKYATAFLVWTGINIGLLFGTLFLLRQETTSHFRQGPLMQGILALGFFPVAFDLVQGQDSILVLLLLTLFFTSLQRSNDIRAGIYLALGLFKFHLIVPLFLIIVLKKRNRVVLGFGCTALALLMCSVAIVGWTQLVYYPKYLWALNQAPALAGMKPEAMPNIRGLLSGFLRQSGNHLAVQVGLFAVCCLGIITAAKIWDVNRHSDLSKAGFSFSVVVIMVTSYYANSYDLTLLVLPVLLTCAVVLTGDLIRGWPRHLCFACIALLLCSPLYWVLAIGVNEFYWTSVVLLVFVVALGGATQSLRALQPEFTSLVQRRWGESL